MEDDPSNSPTQDPKDPNVVKAQRALADAKGQLMDGEAIFASLLSINPSADVRSGVAEERAKLQKKIDDAMASLQKAKDALEPSNNGGRRRKTRKGKGGRKAKRGTRRH
jgi:hypothetical protein